MQINAVKAAVVAKLKDGWHINSHRPLDSFSVPTELTIAPPAGFVVENIAYPAHEIIKLSFSPESVAVYSGKFIFGVVIKPDSNTAPGNYELKGTLSYQACNDSQCMEPTDISFSIFVTVLPKEQPQQSIHQDVFEKVQFSSAESPTHSTTSPEETQSLSPAVQAGNWQELADQFTLIGSGTGYMEPKTFSTFLENVAKGTVSVEKSMFANRSVLGILVLILLGGLALNLTPCVFPLIPINLAIIGAGTKSGSRKRGFLLGGSYGAGIALAYGVLGLIVILTTGSFGQINASPWFNAIIAVIFVLLGLAMLDLFLIDFTRFQSSITIRRKEGGSYLVAFAMGVVSALLAGACVAPVVIAVVLFSRDLYSTGAYWGLLLPFLLGIGMALPWPFAGAGLAFLPKPGKWMVRVKQGFAVLILGFAVYYGYLSVTLFQETYGVNRTEVLNSSQQMDKDGWIPSLEQGLDTALKERKTVVIDFWATWCKSCLAMNKTTFQDSGIKTQLEPMIKIKYQAENQSDAVTKEVMRHFDIIGLPTYVVLKPK